MSEQKKRGPKPLPDDQKRQQVKVYLRPPEIEALRLAGALDGAPHDHRNGGTAVGPYLVTLGLDRIRALTGAPDDAPIEDLIEALKAL